MEGRSPRRAVTIRIGKWSHAVDELNDRARPAVHHQQRNGVGPGGSHMKGVNALAVNFGGNGTEGI
jgi:hypothetical protein